MNTHEPGREPCPYCGVDTFCDTVDVGVGFVQCGPYHCTACGATECGAYDTSPDDLARRDPKTGWFKPGDPPGSSANMLNGKLASAKDTTDAYKTTFTRSPLHEIPGFVDQWFKGHRQPRG